jgi:uncharacterized membrane protein YgcG
MVLHTVAQDLRDKIPKVADQAIETRGSGLGEYVVGLGRRVPGGDLARRRAAKVERDHAQLNLASAAAGARRGVSVGLSRRALFLQFASRDRCATQRHAIARCQCSVIRWATREVRMRKLLFASAPALVLVVSPAVLGQGGGGGRGPGGGGHGPGGGGGWSVVVAA